MTGITATGIGSGLDVGGLVQQLLAAEAEPVETRLGRQESGVLARISAYGTIKSALADFQTKLGELDDIDTLLGRTVSFAENEFFSVTVDDSASPAEFDLDIQRIAVAQKLVTGAYADSSSTIGYGNLTVSSGDNTFVVGIQAEGASLEAIRDAINNEAANTSVRATVVTSDSGSYLSLSALETGKDAAISIVASGGDGGLAALEYDSATQTGSLSEAREALDALISIDGLDVTSSSNSISGALQGVTIELLGADAGTLHNVRVDFDRDGLEGKLREFADAYNAVIDAAESQTAFDAETGTAGALLGDTTLRTIVSQLRRDFGAVNSAEGAEFATLSEIGLTLDVEGRATVDDEALSSAVAGGFVGIGNLFTGENGVAVRLAALSEELLASDGALEVRTSGLQETIDDIASQRESLAERLVILEGRLLDQFNALDVLVSELTSTSNFLTQQLSALPTQSSR